MNKPNCATIVLCKDCMFFDPMSVSKNMGYCHFDPPVIIPGSGSRNGFFPTVSVTNWCGAGTRRDEEL